MLASDCLGVSVGISLTFELDTVSVSKSPLMENPAAL